MTMYEIETEYKKIIPTGKNWWHWRVYEIVDDQRRYINGDSSVARTRWGAKREAKKFIKELNTLPENSKQSVYYEY